MLLYVCASLISVSVSLSIPVPVLKEICAEIDLARRVSGTRLSPETDNSFSEILSYISRGAFCVAFASARLVFSEEPRSQHIKHTS